MFITESSKRKLTHIAVIGAFSIAVMLSSFYYGVTSGNDFPQHFQFANTIHRSIVSGEIYPSWSDTQNQGYGDAAIRFYPPFAYYELSASYFLTGNWYDASLLTFFLIFWVGGIGIYFWAKEAFSDNQSLLAAGIYIFSPYHVNLIYNNFLYAEFAASAILPFCFLFVSRVCRRGYLADILGLSISFALLLITHLPLSIIGSICLFVYALLLLKKDSVLTTLPKLLAAVVSAFAASSFYLIRMITELNWVKHSNDTYFLRNFDYRENFLFASQNILNFQNDVSVLWFADLMLFATILISIPSAIYFFKTRKSLSKLSIAIAAVFVVSILMTTPLSKPVWDNLTFLQKVQFPWRWMSIVSMFGAVFSSIGLFQAKEAMDKNKNLLLSVGLGIILTVFVFTSAFIIKQAIYLPREEFNKQLATIDSDNSFDCWWTIWANSEALKVKEKVSVENRTAEVVKWGATEKEFNVSAGQSSPLRVATFFYPHWRATVNDKPVEIQMAGDSSILIPLPKESSNVKLYFQEPYFVRIANFVSLGIWIIFVFLSGILFLRNTDLKSLVSTK